MEDKWATLDSARGLLHLADEERVVGRRNLFHDAAVEVRKTPRELRWLPRDGNAEKLLLRREVRAGEVIGERALVFRKNAHREPSTGDRLVGTRFLRDADQHARRIEGQGDEGAHG